MEWLIPSIICLLLFTIGIMLFNGKWANLIAGYNTSSKEEKAQWNQKALCRFVGCLCMFIAIAMMLMTIASRSGNLMLTYGMIGAILVIVVAAIIYVNLSKRFKAQ